ncbi:MAG: cytidine deaminase [Proteobacteria bacterium]|nr:cytidine deaminase [Pseudomonadota bacterium]
MKPNPLHDLAVKAMENSYSPYSRKKVGAVVELTDGRTFTGCNIENSSFGGTVCAERVAIWKAVSEAGPAIRLQKVVVATDASPPWFPCGICRQVINEFAADNCEIHLVNKAGAVNSFTHRELLPHGFGRDALEDPSINHQKN